MTGLRQKRISASLRTPHSTFYRDQKEPRSCVMISMQDLEDTIWGQRALEAANEGMIDEDKSAQLMDAILSAED